MRLDRAVRLYGHARRAEVRPLTRRGQGYVLDSFVREVGGEMALRAIKPSHIQNWLGQMDVAVSTLRFRLCVVRTFFQWCVNERHIKVDPTATIRGPRPARSLPRELSPEQVHQILDAAPDARARLILSLSYYCGLRRAEIAGLEVGDIGEDVMSVVGKGDRERLLPIAEHTKSALRDYLGEHPASVGPLVRSYSTGNALAPDWIGQIAANAIKDSGLKVRPHDGVSLHAGRHTYAGALLDHGADVRVVQVALGHANISTAGLYLRRRHEPADIRPYLPDYASHAFPAHATEQ